MEDYLMNYSLNTGTILQKNSAEPQKKPKETLQPPPPGASVMEIAEYIMERDKEGLQILATK